MNGAMGARASMHELPGRPSYHTQQSIAMNYAGVQKFAGDVFRDGTMVFTDNRHRDGTQRSPHSMMSFVELNRFLRDDDDGRLFQNPRAFAFNHTLIGKFHADQVEGNHLERNILGRDLINPKRSLVYSSHISGSTSYDNYWGRLLSMGTQAWLMLREVKTSTEAGRQRRDAVLALLGGPKGSTASLDALQRAQAEMMKSNNAKYLQLTPLVRGYTFRQVSNFESKLRSPDYAFYYVGLCVDNGAYNQTTARKDDGGIMYVEREGPLWNMNWIGDLRVDILVRGPELISCDPNVIADYNLRRAGEYVEPSSMIGEEMKRKKKQPDYGDGHGGARFPAQIFDMGTQEVRWDDRGGRKKLPCKEVMTAFALWCLGKDKATAGKMVAGLSAFAQETDDYKEGGKLGPVSQHFANMFGVVIKGAVGAAAARTGVGTNGNGGGDRAPEGGPGGSEDGHVGASGVTPGRQTFGALLAAHDSRTSQVIMGDAAIDVVAEYAFDVTGTEEAIWTRLIETSAVRNVRCPPNQKLRKGDKLGVEPNIWEPATSARDLDLVRNGLRYTVSEFMKSNDADVREAYYLNIRCYFLRFHQDVGTFISSLSVDSVVNGTTKYDDYLSCARVLTNMGIMEGGFEIVSLPLPGMRQYVRIRQNMLDAAGALPHTAEGVEEQPLPTKYPDRVEIALKPLGDGDAARMVRAKDTEYMTIIANVGRRTREGSWEEKLINKGLPITSLVFKSWFLFRKASHSIGTLDSLVRALNELDTEFRRMDGIENMPALQESYWRATSLFFQICDAPTVDNDQIFLIDKYRKTLVALGCITGDSREAMNKEMRQKIFELREIMRTKNESELRSFVGHPIAGNECISSESAFNMGTLSARVDYLYRLIAALPRGLGALENTIPIDMARSWLTYSKHPTDFSLGEMDASDMITLANKVFVFGAATYSHLQVEYRDAAIGLFLIENEMPDETPIKWTLEDGSEETEMAGNFAVRVREKLVSVGAIEGGGG